VEWWGLEGDARCGSVAGVEFGGDCGLISLSTRSSGFVDRTFFRCSIEDALNASTLAFAVFMSAAP